MIQGG